MIKQPGADKVTREERISAAYKGERGRGGGNKGPGKVIILTQRGADAGSIYHREMLPAAYRPTARALYL